ncbi:MAG: HEAT repeat domain-containing protein [Verrucomicrobiia bacterium]
MKTAFILLSMAMFSLFVVAEPTNLPPYLNRPTWDWIYGPNHSRGTYVAIKPKYPSLPPEPTPYGRRVRFWMTPFGSQSPGAKYFYRFSPPFAPYWMLRYECHATNQEDALLESERVVPVALSRICKENWGYFHRQRLSSQTRQEIALALKDPNPNVRWNAVFAIIPLYFEDLDALLLLVPSLKDEDPRVKLAAVIKWNQIQKKRGGKTLPLPLSSSEATTNLIRQTGK